MLTGVKIFLHVPPRNTGIKKADDVFVGGTIYKNYFISINYKNLLHLFPSRWHTCMA